MRPLALQTLTWATVAAAVVSAFWLAAADPGWHEWRSVFGDALFQGQAEPAAKVSTRAAPQGATGEPASPVRR